MGKTALVLVLVACLLIGIFSYVILSTNLLNTPQAQGGDNPNPEATPTPSTSENPNNNPSATPSSGEPSSNPSPKPTVPINTDPPPGPHVNEVDHEVSSDYVWNSSEVIEVGLNGNSITVSQPNVATVEGSRITITTAGTYRLSGSLTDGQVIVNADKALVRLILNNVNIHCSQSAPIYVVDSKKTIIILEEGTQNTITDNSNYKVDSSGEPNGAVFSKSDLTIYGKGTLNVQAHYNDGIASKDGLVINSEGQITVNAVDDGIRGKDYLVVRKGQINVNARDGDGLKSDDTEDVARGYITIENGVLQITAGRDAVDAQTDFLMKNGQFTAVAGGGSSNNVVEDRSTKGIKATVDLVIENGFFDIDSSDDAIHSNGTLTIHGGKFDLTTNDDGMHADGALVINSCVINIPKCFEGLESSVMTINGGNIHITSRDDGVNIAGGKDASGFTPRPGQDTFSSGDYHLFINGGYIYIEANGDGIDSNGAITMTDGKVIVNGPTSRYNTAIDHDKPFKMTGGYLIGVGSTGTQIAPAQGPSSTSTQYSILFSFNSSRPTDTLINLQTSSGEEIFSFRTNKAVQSFVFSSTALANGVTYDIYVGGTTTGTPIDGLYTGGTYTPGTKYTSFTISNIITKLGPPPPLF